MATKAKTKFVRVTVENAVLAFSPDWQCAYSVSEQLGKREIVFLSPRPNHDRDAAGEILITGVDIGFPIPAEELRTWLKNRGFNWVVFVKDRKTLAERLLSGLSL